MGFDILLAGHQHTAAENVRINGTYTCQPPDKARQYIKMDVIVDGQITAEQHLMDAGNVTQAKAKALLLPAENRPRRGLIRLWGIWIRRCCPPVI